MSEAIFVISEDNFLAFFGLNHNQRVRLHWILQVGAAVSLTIGYISILLYKHKYNQSHLDTWHSVTGFISLILFVISVLWGVGIMYSSVTGIKNWIKPAKIKLIHIVFGVLTFVMGIVSEGFGIYLPWFLYYSNKEAQLVCTLLITLASILSIQSALVSVYKRTKRILQNADCRLF
ncbi:hypothetical protein C0J52_12413 [Blattella germanica]|nr:hypothetical protein C0J52_12413 [Blattella germanica]